MKQMEEHEWHGHFTELRIYIHKSIFKNKRMLGDYVAHFMSQQQGSPMCKNLTSTPWRPQCMQTVHTRVFQFSPSARTRALKSWHKTWVHELALTWRNEQDCSWTWGGRGAQTPWGCAYFENGWTSHNSIDGWPECKSDWFARTQTRVAQKWAVALGNMTGSIRCPRGLDLIKKA